LWKGDNFSYEKPRLQVPNALPACYFASRVMDNAIVLQVYSSDAKGSNKPVISHLAQHRAIHD